MGCTTLRGRADDALERGDYRNAVALYTQVLAEHPGDREAKSKLTRAERGLLDEGLDGFERNRTVDAALAALTIKDGVHADAIDDARSRRIQAMVRWTSDHMSTLIDSETQVGRALAARAYVKAWKPVLARPELHPLVARFEEKIATSGRRTCALATQTAGDQPFALELVAAYCKEVGGAMPPWRPRPLLVAGIDVRGTIIGTPRDEQADLEHAIVAGLERSVWYAPTAAARASADVGGSVSSDFTATRTELSRGWTESVPYEATETYSEPVQVPYTDYETYYERVPYTAYEDRLEQCRPPRKGLCNKTRPVTKYRDEERRREVTKYRTDYVEKQRVVTRYRDEPRVFTFSAIRHDGRYQASYRVVLDLGGGRLRPVTVTESKEDARTGYEHDADFAPAGVHPERPDLPSARAWRDDQRTRLQSEVARALDQAWVESFCSEAVATTEDAARCVHARPTNVPKAVRARIAELVADDPARVLALPRPKESLTPSP